MLMSCYNLISSTILAINPHRLAINPQLHIFCNLRIILEFWAYIRDILASAIFFSQNILIFLDF